MIEKIKYGVYLKSPSVYTIFANDAQKSYSAASSVEVSSVLSPQAIVETKDAATTSPMISLNTFMIASPLT